MLRRRMNYESHGQRSKANQLGYARRPVQATVIILLSIAYWSWWRSLASEGPCAVAHLDHD